MWDKEKEIELRQLVKDSGVKLLEENLVQGTWGNISVRLDEDNMLVTPTGLDYNHLTPEDMPIVQISDPDNWHDGKKPTSERKIHAAVLESRPEINACIHSHPVFATIMASCRMPLPAFNDELKNVMGGDVFVGSYGLPGTKKLKEGTVMALQGRNACFMANHGVFCVGKTMEEAFDVLRLL
ncbi:MAG: class II aldolase/adducin family protein, partial [Clostridia bacterium]|nr:class II aldolase/adducin family protein [Clostridia bacterium]